MTAEYLLGIDIGTYESKGVLPIDAAGPVGKGNINSQNRVEALAGKIPKDTTLHIKVAIFTVLSRQFVKSVVKRYQVGNERKYL
jgi:hypothetical protein